MHIIILQIHRHPGTVVGVEDTTQSVAETVFSSGAKVELGSTLLLDPTPVSTGVECTYPGADADPIGGPVHNQEELTEDFPWMENQLLEVFPLPV